MEHIVCELSAEKFDLAVRGGLDHAVTLPEGGDLAFYVKPHATHGGQAGVAITFTVQLPDGRFARAQAVTTLKLLEFVARTVDAMRRAGRLDENN